MFEDPNGIRYIGTPAWKTKNYYHEAVRLEHGDLETKVVSEQSPERREVVAEKT